MPREHVYCCECRRAPCICTAFAVFVTIVVIILGLASYGVYKLLT